MLRDEALRQEQPLGAQPSLLFSFSAEKIQLNLKKEACVSAENVFPG